MFVGKVIKIQILTVIALLSFSAAWAVDSPIGELVTKGEVTVTGKGISVKIKDERYAYFPGDVIRTNDQSRAAIVTNDGTRIRFAELSAGRVLFLDGAYAIDRIDGQITLEADSGVPYQVLNNGEPVGKARLLSDGDPVVIATSYIPAQLSDAQIEALEATGSFTAEEIEALKEATRNMSQDELANMTEADLKALLEESASTGGLSTGAKIGIAAAVIIGAAAIISDDDDDGDGDGDTGGGGETQPPVPSPPPPPAPPRPPAGGSTPDTPDDKGPGS